MWPKTMKRMRSGMAAEEIRIFTILESRLSITHRHLPQECLLSKDTRRGAKDPCRDNVMECATALMGCSGS